MIVSGVIILQDYLFALIKKTSFYWSEVLLFKGYWLIFIPFSLMVLWFYKRFPITKPKLFYSLVGHVVFSILLSLSQLLLFALFVSYGSKLFFDYSFNTIDVFIQSFAKDFYLSILVYWVLIIIYHYSLRRNLPNKQSTKKILEFIQVRKGKEMIPIDVNEINWINKTGQYISIHMDEKKHLHNQSLSQIENSLDSKTFARIHRSTIVNVKFVKKLRSRSNGDHDVFLKDGTVLRLSRNYKKNVVGILL